MEMSKKSIERSIGKLFIEEYNREHGSSFRIDDDYLKNRSENDFPDLRFIDDKNGKKILAEVVRAIEEKILREKDKLDVKYLIEVDPASELFNIIEKKNKHYEIKELKKTILIIHLPFYFYTEKNVHKSLCNSVKKCGYNFKEIWATWEEVNEKIKPFKLS